MRDLTLLSREELQNFFNSFDQILCDVHGVLWNILGVIPGTPKAVKSLQKLGKRFIIVSNDTTVSIDEYHETTKLKGFQIERDNIVTPTLAMISHLKKQNFSKEIFVLGTPSLKKSLQEAGFKIAEDGPHDTAITLQEFSSVCSTDNGNVGAVIEDIDLNLNYINLQKAATFLKREILFLKGTGDMDLCVESNTVLIGPGRFHTLLEEKTGKTPIGMAKPSFGLNEYIVEKYKIMDPARVLFVGDSIHSDMGFASKFGYKKLLVLSGLATKDLISNWNFADDYRPDYYIDSLGAIDNLLY